MRRPARSPESHVQKSLSTRIQVRGQEPRRRITQEIATFASSLSQPFVIARRIAELYRSRASQIRRILIREKSRERRKRFPMASQATQQGYKYLCSFGTGRPRISLDLNGFPIEVLYV